jgi:SET domain-containing protein
MPASYLSPKTRVGPSPIEGQGLFARRRIRKGEIVAIKGGHVYDARTLARIKRRVAASYIQITDGFFIGARTAAEVRGNKMFLNHSCAPNVGVRGQIVFVALRDIRAGEELTYDWAMEENARDRTRCRCGTRRCRRVLTGRDWRIPRLQRRYRGYFSSYLEDKIRARGTRVPGARHARRNDW